MKRNYFAKAGMIVLAAVVVAAFAVSDVHAGKMKITGKNRTDQVASQSTAAPGDKAGHMLTQTVTMSTTTSSNEDWNNTKMFDAQQTDQQGDSGTHKGYGYHINKNGDKTFFKYWGTQKAMKDIISLEGKFEWTGGTGKFQNIKGGGAYTCKGGTTSNACDWQGEVEY